ncbi:MAG: hypothetical protein HYT46_02240 [Candidatus Vogelbacteria bacterium]|nr:hypothetical protein [Candidatus Vogelbacteria bacterium]
MTMTKTSKKYVWILVVLVVIVGIIFLARQNNNSSVPPQNNLIPEQSISHGHGLAVDVAGPNKLWIATHYGLLLLENEKDLYRVGKLRDDYMGFSPHPTDQNVFFTSGHPARGGNLGFQRSDDGGSTWKKISNGANGPVDFHAMAVSPINSNLIYGWHAGNLQRSEDQGASWKIINQEIVAVYLAADSENENKLYAATPRGQGVMVSEDKGTTWQALSPALEGGAVSVVAVHPQNSKILLASSEKLGGLGKSSDSGQTWARVNESFGGEAVLHIAFSRIDVNIVYALTHENKLFKSSDAGDTWVQIR